MYSKENSENIRSIEKVNYSNIIKNEFVILYVKLRRR